MDYTQECVLDVVVWHREKNIDSFFGWECHLPWLLLVLSGQQFICSLLAAWYLVGSIQRWSALYRFVWAILLFCPWSRTLYRSVLSSPKAIVATGTFQPRSQGLSSSRERFSKSFCWRAFSNAVARYGLDFTVSLSIKNVKLAMISSASRPETKYNGHISLTSAATSWNYRTILVA